MKHSRLRTEILLGTPGLVLGCVLALALAASQELSHSIISLQAGLGLILVWSVAVAVQQRYPQRPMGLLLFGVALLYIPLALQSSSHPLLFSLARMSRPMMEVMLVWLMLAFPSGRLQTRVERWLLLSAWLALALLWLPSVLLSSEIPMPGPMVLCQADCPRNVLALVEKPALAQGLNLAFRFVGCLVMVGAAGVLFNRLRVATPLMRRALAPVLIVSMLRAGVDLMFLIGTGSGNRIAFTLTFFAVPLAIALGLLRGRIYTARALQMLVSGLRSRPDMQGLRQLLAKALGDPSLSLAFWIHEKDCWVDEQGRHVALPYPSSERGRAATLVNDDQGRPVAALVHDSALQEEPHLVESLASSVQVALESHRLEAELASSSARAASAVEEERQRIERDLHDGAQQRLIALRMKLSVTARLLEQDLGRARSLVGEMGSDVEAAIAELRSYAHGVVPPLLLERGLSFALAEAAQRSPIRTQLALDDIGRCEPGIERAVYFCCLEALQNAAKHGGPEASARLSLHRAGEVLGFGVEDDGQASTVGSGRPSGGQGLVNMRERIAAVGGHLTIERRPEGGYRVAGSVLAPALKPRSLA